MTLDDILRRNRLRHPRHAALVFGDRQASWQELDERVDRLANAFAASGLTKGDRVAVLLGNCPEYLEIYFAVARCGLIVVPLNYRLSVGEMDTLLAHAEPKLLIVADDMAERLAHHAGVPRWRVGGEAGGDGYEAVVAGAAALPVAARAAANDTLGIFYTSGTTGLPKGAMVSHRNLTANAVNQIIADRAVAEDVNLISSPLYHMGAVFMAVTYMTLGCTQVVLPGFDPRAWLETLAGKRATVSLLVPTMINSILNCPAIEGADLSSLRLIFYGGGPMPPAVLRRALGILGCSFTQGYGLTETLEATFLVASDHVVDGTEAQQRRLASVGREAVDADVRVVGANGRDLAPGEVGEVLVRSKSVISGYWRMPEETAAALSDGWFHTGDLGYLDEERYLFVVDRLKDMVVSGGVNIYTKEVEGALYGHPAVLEAAVFGSPDEQWGEVVTAAIVLRPGMAAGAEELAAHCAGSIASFKKPRRIIFLDELPKNASGKILKRELRKMVG